MVSGWWLLVNSRWLFKIGVGVGIDIGIEIYRITFRYFRTALTPESVFSRFKTKKQKGKRNRPEWRGGISVKWEPNPDVVFRLSTLYVGDVFDSSIPTGDRTLDDYLSFRAKVGAKMCPIFL